MSSVIQALRSRHMFVVLLLGFSSGIPLALTGTTLQAWMKTENVDLTVIGLFSLVGLPYALKFLWAPLMDRYVPPFLGRRRGWMMITQLLLALSIAALAFSSPAQLPQWTALLAVLVAFCSASQDIVIDAYRTDVIPKPEMGLAAALYIGGYRVAMLVSGAIALILADQLPWKMVYLIMASTMCVGVVASWIGPEPAAPALVPKSLGEAVVLPFVEFFKRKGATEMLLFALIYKLDIVFGVALLTPFMMELGFTKTDIGAVNKGLGLAATLLGTFLGGAWMIKLGLERSLWVFGLAQGISNLSFMLLAHLGHSYPVMVMSIGLENLCSGMGNAAYTAFLMSICDRRFTATQYALLSSLMALGRVLGSAPTGYVAKAVGWEQYFLLATLIAIPGLLLLTRFKKWAAIQDAS